MKPWADPPCAVRWCTRPGTDAQSELCVDHVRGWHDYLRGLGPHPHPWSVVIHHRKWVDWVSRLDGRGPTSGPPR